MSSPSNFTSRNSKAAASGSGITWEKEKFSISVNEVLENIDRKESGANIGELLEICKRIHPNYGKRLKDTQYYKQFGKADFSENFKRCVDDSILQQLTGHRSKEWAEIVLSIMTLPAKTSFIRAEVPVVNTRMFISAAVLNQFREIYQFITKTGKKSFAEFCYLLVVQFEDELEDDEKIILKECLLQKGQELYNGLKATRYKKFEPRSQSDYPAKEDSLSRSALAAYIAKRLRYIYNADIKENNRKKDRNKYGSFFMHIDGEWGSGKSTLLDFLQEALETPAPQDNKTNPIPFSEGRWVIIRFNAWENQRLDPPWWFLMKKVFGKAVSALGQLSWKGYTQQKEKDVPRMKEPRLRNFLRLANMRFHEIKWRLYTGGVYLLIAIVTLALTVFAIYVKWPAPESGSFDWQKLPVVQLISLIGFIWSSVQFVRTGLLSGSAKAAQSFEQNSKDPMVVLSRHFTRLTNRIGHPVAIFIDDLDRCNKDYGVKLLEGLQTIFRSAPVVYVVAADKRWLRAMYESQYSLFAQAVEKPAKPFGTVFLDKTFQYTLELPDISAVQKKLYWNKLLNIKKAKAPGSSTVGQSQMLVQGEASLTHDKEEIAQGEREDRIKATSIAEEEETMEYKLQDFVELIEPNPRTMKRLINDVSTAINLAQLYDQDIDDTQLVLWTILKLQYPSLAAFYWKNPDAIDKIHESPSSTKLTSDEVYDALLRDPSVRKLFRFTIGGEEVILDSRFLHEMKFQESEIKEKNSTVRKPVRPQQHQATQNEDT